jgi:lysophospholipase L1-like esterase
MQKHICTFLLTLALVSVACASGPAVGDKLKAAIARSRMERVAVIGIGDSNQRFGGHGYTAAMPVALARIAPIYATDMAVYREWNEKDGPAPTAAPEALSRLAAGWYIAPGATGKVSWRNGLLIVPADHPLDVRGPLRFHFTYGTFAEGASVFEPVVRRDRAPWTVLASSKRPVSTAAGQQALARLTLDLPADSSRDYPVQFMPQNVQAEINGPFFAVHAVAENTARKNGLAYHTLYGVGGHSVKDMLTAFRERGPARVKTFFTDVRGLLNGSMTAVIVIHSGLNDRNRSEPSIGPAGGFVSSTLEGYADNLEGLVRFLTAAWIEAGGTPETVHFAFMPSHALGDPDDEKLVSYRKAASELAARLPNASMIDIPALVPYAEMKAGGYYDKGRSSDAHLDRKGYDAITAALADALKP